MSDLDRPYVPKPPKRAAEGTYTRRKTRHWPLTLLLVCLSAMAGSGTAFATWNAKLAEQAPTQPPQCPAESGRVTPPATLVELSGGKKWAIDTQAASATPEDGTLGSDPAAPNRMRAAQDPGWASDETMLVTDEQGNRACWTWQQGQPESDSITVEVGGKTVGFFLQPKD